MSGPFMESIRIISGTNTQKWMLLEKGQGAFPDDRPHIVRMTMGSGLKSIYIKSSEQQEQEDRGAHGPFPDSGAWIGGQLFLPERKHCPPAPDVVKEYQPNGYGASNLSGPGSVH